MKRWWRRSRLRRWWKTLHDPRCERCGSPEWDVKQYVYVCAECRTRWPVQPDMRWLDRADQWLYRHRVLVAVGALVLIVAAAAVFARPGPG